MSIIMLCYSMIYLVYGFRLKCPYCPAEMSESDVQEIKF